MSTVATQVFLSYGSADLERVRPLVDALEQAGVRVWVDHAGIPGGASYGSEIVSAIRESVALVLCCSPASFASRNVRQEVALAWKHERPVMPLLLEPAEVPDELAYWLEAAQWIEVLDRPEDKWLPEVLRALQRLGVDARVPPTARTEGVNASSVHLPTPLTRLLGREAEVRRVSQLLEAHRLVTLTGPGGVGKTRIAIEAAHTVASSFLDNATFIDLAPVRDPDRVLATIADALSLRDAPGTDLGRISVEIGERSCLLVLDNMEQVLGVAPTIVALLTACPHLAVLATSRAPLSVRGERVVAIEPLLVPDPTSLELSIDELTSSPAVALFAERATEVSPDFALTTDNLGTVVQICARLEGLPLAIELAAARIRQLSPDGLLARLAQVLPLLTGGPRDLPDRQRTLRDAIAWSHDLLVPEEKIIFRRLAVFVRGCSADLAVQVCDPNGSLSVQDRLATLVDHNLLRRTMSEGENRFWMLEAVHEFAWEQLRAAEEEASMQEQLALWALELGGRAPGLTGTGEDPLVLPRVANERANFRAALEWLEQSGRNEDLLRLTNALFSFWYFAGLAREGQEWATRAIARAPDGPPALRASVLFAMGHNAHYLGDDIEAATRTEQGRALARELGDLRLQAEGDYILGIIAEDTGDHDQAEVLFGAAKAGYETFEGDWGQAASLYHLGIQAYGKGDLTKATAIWNEVAQNSRVRGETILVGWSLDYLGLVAAQQGDVTAAAAALDESLSLVRGDLLHNHLDMLLGAVAVLAASIDMPESAVRLIGAIRVEQGVTRIRYSFPERRVFEHTEAVLQAGLGVDVFARLIAEGERLGSADVLDEARAVLAAGRKSP